MATKHPNIFKALDLKAGHLPQEVYENLKSFDGVIAYSVDYGYLLLVPEDVDKHFSDYADEGEGEPEEYRTPPALLVVLRHARKLGCDYILLDRDGRIDPGLPTYDW
jgi:hypothetical protein